MLAETAISGTENRQNKGPQWSTTHLITENHIHLRMYSCIENYFQSRLKLNKLIVQIFTFDRLTVYKFDGIVFGPQLSVFSKVINLLGKS